MYAKKALQIAIEAHKGQKDKAGVDYINHPIAVAAMMTTDEEKAVAYLHDVVEDTQITLEQLAGNGFSYAVIDAIDAITRRHGESYDEYLERVKQNSLALVVKCADLQHNSDITRFAKPTERDKRRCEKYKRTLTAIKNEFKRLGSVNDK